MFLNFMFLIFLVILLPNTNADFQTEINALKAEVKELKSFKATQTTYCRLHAKGKCGSCICKDDFNLPEKFYCDCQNQPAKRDCLEFYLQGYRVSGIYHITMNGFRTTQVYCDQSYLGGGWTVVQRRMDGSTDFYRNWKEYKYGFGELQREFWMGNEYIHLVTAQAIYPKGSEAVIRLKRFGHDHDDFIHRYSHFQVDNEKSKFMLHVSGPSGGIYASDLTTYHDTMEFSTFDQDNDGSTSNLNCAANYNYGGWWYNGKTNDCTSKQARTNLNGQYDRHRLLSWYKILNIGNQEKLGFSEIMVRRLR